MNNSDIETLLKFQEKILHFGLSFKTPRPQRAQSRYGSIDVVTIPTCLYKRFYRQVNRMFAFDEGIISILSREINFILNDKSLKYLILFQRESIFSIALIITCLLTEIPVIDNYRYFL